MNYQTKVTFETIQTHLKGYVEKCDDLEDELVASGASGYIKSIIMGRNSYNSSTAHVEYFHAMERDTRELAEALKAEDSDTAAQVACDVCKLLLEPAPEERPYMELMTMTDDQLCGQFIRYLKTEDLQSFYDMCKADPKHFVGVPSQEVLVEKMENLLREKGGKVIEKTFRQKLKDFFGII